MKPLLVTILFSMFLAGCLAEATPDESLTLNAAATLTRESRTPLPTATPKPTYSTTPPATNTPTAVPMATLEARATIEALETMCDQPIDFNFWGSSIAPDGQWVAVGCESDRNTDLIVTNKGDLRWVLHFANYLNPELGEFERSGLWALAWSSDGRFLFFTKTLSWSGGSDSQCFAGLGVYGLYRLDLNTGTVVTLVPTDDFNGKQIRFSPTSEYYAIDNNGVTITNLANEEITSIDFGDHVMAMEWSPDGRHLAFSTARCAEYRVESSSIFVWDTSTNQTQLLFSSEEFLLRPRSWINNLLLEIEGEKWVDRNNEYTIFEYDLERDEMIFSATATPYQ